MKISGHDGNGAYMTANVSKETTRKVDFHAEEGADIIINTNWRFKGHGYGRVVKICQTNNRYNGCPKHIVWACYPQTPYINGRPVHGKVSAC